MTTGVAKLGDFVKKVELETISVSGKTSNNGCFNIYLPKRFANNRCEIYCDWKTMTMLVCIVPSKEKNGVLIHGNQAAHQYREDLGRLSHATFGSGW